MSSRSHYLAHIQHWYTYVQDGNSADKAYQRLCMGRLATVAPCMTSTWLVWLTIKFVVATCFAVCPVILLVALVTRFAACLFRLAVVYFVRTVFSSVAVATAVYPLLATVAPSVVTRSWTTVTFVALKHILCMVPSSWLLF